jgi:hypothetical protein
MRGLDLRWFHRAIASLRYAANLIAMTVKVVQVMEAR